MKGEGLTVTRSCLPSGQPEAPGYGAYTYVLLPKQPDADPRYIALLDAYAKLPPDDPSKGDEDIWSLEKRNLTYVPVTQKPPRGGLRVQWLVQNYDLTRASRLIAYQQLKGPGPFLVTCQQPLSSAPVPQGVAVVDLSYATEHSIPHWLNYFVRAQLGPKDWERGVELVLLNMQDDLSNIGVTPVIEALGPIGKILQAAGLSK